jgi:hypothetical protein
MLSGMKLESCGILGMKIDMARTKRPGWHAATAILRE